ncbi:MAG: FecR domain-containing protein, partial [Nitrospinota bacterium]
EGLIRSGQKPEAAAHMAAYAAMLAGVPVNVVVQGAVAAAAAAGIEAAGIVQAASQGAVAAAAAGVEGPMTKGKFVERFFVDQATRPPEAAAYVPEGAEALPPAERFAAVAGRLAARGVKALEGSKPEDPLTRTDFIALYHVLSGGQPGAELGEQKNFLKQKGILEPDDVGLIKSFQGEATIQRAGADKPIKMTGAEAVIFRDSEETTFGARVELLFDDGTTLSISEDTVMTIDEMVYNPKDKFRAIKLRLRAGTIRVNTSATENPNSRVDVLTPTLVAGLRGTDALLSVNPAGNTNLITTVGTVDARQPAVTDRPPAPRAPAPGPAPVLPATPPPAVTVTPGNSTQSNVGAAAPTPPAPAPPAQIAAATAALAITNPAPPAPVSMAGPA